MNLFRPKIARVLLAGCAVCLPFSAHSLSAEACFKSAALWMPTEATIGKVVNKWQKNISFAILSQGSDSETAGTIREKLKLISKQTGLEVAEQMSSVDATPDLLVAIIPDVENEENASLARTLAQKFLQGKVQNKGSIAIDNKKWTETIKRTEPKCLGIDTQSNGELLGAFLIVQRGETSQCIDVGLSQSFGVMAARTHYATSDRSLSSDLLENAFHSLYSKKISAGMSEEQAKHQLEEVCK